eukprot:Skav217441  [mRNA]  locus=scaffold1485:207257:208408:- [translate_table: standard]
MQFAANLRDLEAKLVDPQGPLFKHVCSPILKFYTVADPSNELDWHVQVCELGPELHIKQADVGICLEKWPDTGKFVEAMRHNKFDPGSAFFDVKWTAATADKVPAHEALHMVTEVLDGWPTHRESTNHFVQVFGRLTRSIERWNLFNLKLLHNMDPGMMKFKHAVCQHWVELARYVATSMVSNDLQELPPIFLYMGYGCRIVGHTWPSPFDDDRMLTNTLALMGVKISFEWSSTAKCLLFLDWNFQQEGFESFKQRAAEVDIEEPPRQFQKLQPDEILQMVHVQLRLSCCRVAEVQGPIKEECVKILAELLHYKLKILKFEGDTNLDAAIRSFDLEIEQADGVDHRGSVLLITGLPATCKANVFAGYVHRFVLCYDLGTDLVP